MLQSPGVTQDASLYPIMLDLKTGIKLYHMFIKKKFKMDLTTRKSVLLKVKLPGQHGQSLKVL